MKAIATIPQPFGSKTVKIDFPDPKEFNFDLLKSLVPDDCKGRKIIITLEIEP